MPLRRLQGAHLSTPERTRPPPAHRKKANPWVEFDSIFFPPGHLPFPEYFYLSPLAHPLPIHF
jgi:hypothetical protein